MASIKLYYLCIIYISAHRLNQLELVSRCLKSILFFPVVSIASVVF